MAELDSTSITLTSRPRPAAPPHRASVCGVVGTRPRAFSVPEQSAASHSVAIMGNGISMAAPEPAAVSASLFAEYDREQTGIMAVDDLTMLAMRYFNSLPTTPPESWVRTMIMRHDHDEDGFLDQVQFTWAVEDLKKC
jgi:hypothetical protein